MQTRGEKFLLGFLALGILFYVLTWLLGEDSLSNSQGGSSAAGKDTLITRPLPDKTLLPGGVISLESYNLKAGSARQWKLPGRLQEISGLAMTPDNRLLAHNDEKGIIVEIDYQSGSIVKAFGLTDLSKPVADDFEGIAVADARIYLVSSSGRLYECPEGADGPNK